MDANYIVGIMGKKGMGKSFMVKHFMHRIKRKIIIDPMHEYNGTIFYSWDDVVVFLNEYYDLDFSIVYRPLEDEDREYFMRVVNQVNNYTLIAEEVDLLSDSHDIHEELEKLIKYGRHESRNLIWISRGPYEVNRLLTRLTDTMITFQQNEKRDQDFFNNYNFNKDVTILKKYEWAYWGDSKILTSIFGIKIT